MRALVILTVLLVLLPSLAVTGATSPTSVRVADWREGDAWSRDVVESSTFVFLGRQYAFTDEYTESARMETGTLLYADGRTHEVVWSNRSLQLEGYERPFLARQANDLTTGDRLLAPSYLSYQFGKGSFDLLGLGLYERGSDVNNSWDTELFVANPDITTHDLLGGVDLAPGVAFERVIDLRPRHDLVVHVAFEGIAFETLSGRDVLRASLTQTRTEGGVAGVPQESTVWLADDLPLPVKATLHAEAYPVEYRLEMSLLAFEAGTTPIARGTCDEPHEDLEPVMAPEFGPLTRDGPADGSLALLLPLSEAVALVRSPVTNPTDTPAPDAVVRYGAHSMTPTARGEVATWVLEFGASDGSFAEYRVTRETDALLPVPIDRVDVSGSGFCFGCRVPEPDGEQVLTVSDIARLAEAFQEDGMQAEALEFYAYGTSQGVVMTGYATQSTLTRDGTANNGRDEGLSITNAFAGATGVAKWRTWSVLDETRETRLAGLAYEGPRV